MHRQCKARPYGGPSFPRRRGDAPRRDIRAQSRTRFPPQARGCTPVTLATQLADSVSPAGAGMHLRRRFNAEHHQRFPRRRGDAPRTNIAGCRARLFPPQARGCTDAKPVHLGGLQVSPAGAGMHPRSRNGRPKMSCFPRRRGDAPQGVAGICSRVWFPPQARGCTVSVAVQQARECVSPAGAGMHRRPRRSPVPLLGFPRRRGDAPAVKAAERLEARFPPQARGCTQDAGGSSAALRVSPAGAGMHRQ